MEHPCTPALFVVPGVLRDLPRFLDVVHNLFSLMAVEKSPEACARLAAPGWPEISDFLYT